MAMHEVELKLQVEGGRAALEEALGVRDWPLTRLEAHYFDTAGGMLAAHRFAWRVRREDGRWVQTLKGAGGAGRLLQRLEDEVVLPEAPSGDAVPRPDITLHRHSAAGRALAEALSGALDDVSTLVVERYATRVERRTRVFEQDGARVEAAWDVGEIHANGQSLPVCELELELKDGPAEVLCTLARPWVQAHGLWIASASKGARGERLAAGRRHGAAVKAGTPALAWSMTPQALLQSVVAECLAQVLPNAGEVAAGSTEADHVHQARVGLRRLRTALRELGGMAGDAPVLDDAGLQVLAQAFSRLGEVRDQEAVARAVQDRLAAAGAPEGLQWPAPEHEPRPPGAAVRDPAFQAVLLDLIAFTLREPARGPGCGEGDCRRLLRRRLAKLHRQVADDGERFTELSVEHQHRVRKRLKRLRYLAEFVAPLFGRRAVEDYLEALRPAQDALGLHNDDAVGLEAYRRAAARQSEAWFAVGWLQARQHDTARECRRALRKVAQAPRFWKKGHKKGG